ncbi:unnamed protein product [Bursaphelenchus okinawaensis]|uniref:Protein kinase domain-containing protein n=1 Tax=Bursaphelenchus okinawaensis TaxID=465554 RepID=A0A811L813_9BILA|nr:unnamed protein product [Bursaphelenchus okinawaensis]CAG9118422.1 unnamed protein product [Bursaphelenchus okinawaensis]
MATKEEDKLLDVFCKGLFLLTEKCVDEDKQIRFVHKMVTAAEQDVKPNLQQVLIKKMLLHFLRSLQFDSDEELELILELWHKFSKTSRNLGALTVFKNIEKDYNEFWQYYRHLAEILIEHGKEKDIPALLEKCCENCRLTMDEIKEKFGHKFDSIFPKEADTTLLLIQSVKHNPRKSVPSKPEKAAIHRRRSSLAPPKLDMVMEKSIENSLLEDDKGAKGSAGRSDFYETLPASQTTQVVNTQSQPKKTDDFSIFCDQPSPKPQKVKSPPKLACSSPAHKKPKTSLQDSASFENLSDEKENDKRKSLDVNSPTVCGFGRPSNFDMLSSTPESASKAKGNMSINLPTLVFDRVESPLDLSKDVMNFNTKKTEEKRKTPSPHLESALNKLTLCGPGNSEEVLESTINASLEFNGDINPWDENARMEMVRKAHLIVNQHDFTKEKAPKFDVNCKVTLGGENFFITQLLGHGGFAKVFKAANDEDKYYAIKFQKPACPYEVHMIATVCRAMPEKLKEFVMQIQDAFIFRDASAIVYSYGKHGTALDLANTYKKSKREMHGAAVNVIGIQLANVLKYIHKAEIIHADIKPDNLLLCTPIDGPIEIATLMERPIIKLIDFGRAIDMKYFKGKEFRGRAKTKAFDCCEMIDGRPWTYQTDFYGFAASLYLLITNNYMEVTKICDKYKPTVAIKRRLVNRNVFVEILEQFLNIPSCSRLPNWDSTIQFMMTNLKEAFNEEPIPFRNGIQGMYDMISHTKSN